MLKKFFLTSLLIIVLSIFFEKIMNTIELKRLKGAIVYTDGNKIYNIDLSNLKNKIIYSLTQEEITNFGLISGVSCSKEGKKLVFSKRDKMFSSSCLYLIDSEKTGQTKIIKGGFSMLCPSWSPDGKKVAFVVQDKDLQGIYTLNVSDLAITRVCNIYPEQIKPAWSPDGKLLSFTVGTKNQRNPKGQYAIDYQIAVIRYDGADLIKPTNGLRPVWSSNSAIIYLNKDSFYSININSREVSRIFSFPKFGGVDSVAISPDLQYIIYHTYTPDIGPVFVDGFHVIQLKNIKKRCHFGIFSGLVNCISWCSVNTKE